MSQVTDHHSAECEREDVTNGRAQNRDSLTVTHSVPNQGCPTLSPVFGEGWDRINIGITVVPFRLRAAVVAPTLSLKKRDTIFNTGIEYGIIQDVETARKITVEIPADLLEKAQQASGSGITQTVRAGLQLIAASETYARLRRFRGKVRFSRKLAELTDDR